MAQASEMTKAAEREEDRLIGQAESAEEPEALKAEEELAEGVDKDDSFDVPTIQSSSKKKEEQPDEQEAKDSEPFRTLPSQVLRTEMQGAFLDARMIVHHTFDHVTEDQQTSGMKGRLKKDLDFKDYVELVTKVGITLSIARFTSLGIRG